MRHEEAVQTYNDIVNTCKKIFSKVLPELNTDAKHSLKDYSDLVDIFKDTTEAMKDAQKFMCMWSDKGEDTDKRF